MIVVAGFGPPYSFFCKLKVIIFHLGMANSFFRVVEEELSY